MKQALGCLLLGSSLIRATEPANDRARPIVFPAISRDELIAVRLDRAVYSRSANSFADIRIKDTEGATVSHAVRPLTVTHQVVRETTWTPRLARVHPLPEGGLEIDIHLDKDDEAPTGLRIVTPLNNFENRVRITGLNQGEPSEILGRDAAIWDYSNRINSRNDRVTMTSGAFRSFRIVVDKTTAELESQLMELTRDATGKPREKVLVERRPFKIDRIDFYKSTSTTVSGDPVFEDHATRPPAISHDATSQTTSITVDSSLEPVSRISLGVTGGNFNRQVRVEGTDRAESGSWRTLGAGTIRRLSFQNIVEESLVLTIPESRQKAYRLIVEDGDNPPIPIRSVTLSGPVREVILVARPGHNYQLEYGDIKAAAPRLDTADIDVLASRGFTPLQATLGEEITMPVGVPEHHWKERLPWIMGGIMALLGILLAIGLIKAARKVRNLPGETS